MTQECENPLCDEQFEEISPGYSACFCSHECEQEALALAQEGREEAEVEAEREKHRHKRMLRHHR